MRFRRCVRQWRIAITDTPSMPTEPPQPTSAIPANGAGDSNRGAEASAIRAGDLFISGMGPLADALALGWSPWMSESAHAGPNAARTSVLGRSLESPAAATLAQLAQAFPVWAGSRVSCANLAEYFKCDGAAPAARHLAAAMDLLPELEAADSGHPNPFLSQNSLDIIRLLISCDLLERSAMSHPKSALREFFNNDPSTASRNLLAAAVEQMASGLPNGAARALACSSIAIGMAPQFLKPSKSADETVRAFVVSAVFCGCPDLVGFAKRFARAFPDDPEAVCRRFEDMPIRDVGSAMRSLEHICKSQTDAALAVGANLNSATKHRRSMRRAMDSGIFRDIPPWLAAVFLDCNPKTVSILAEGSRVFAKKVNLRPSTVFHRVPSSYERLADLARANMTRAGANPGAIAAAVAAILADASRARSLASASNLPFDVKRTLLGPSWTPSENETDPLSGWAAKDVSAAVCRAKKGRSFCSVSRLQWGIAETALAASLAKGGRLATDGTLLSILGPEALWAAAETIAQAAPGLALTDQARSALDGLLIGAGVGRKAETAPKTAIQPSV